MPNPATWYCGHCSNGPMSIANNTHCSACYKQKDCYARVESADSMDHNKLDRQMLYGFSSVPVFGLHSVHFSQQMDDSHQEHLSILHRPLPIEAAINTSPPFQNRGSDYWFCCHCKDGPKMLANQTRCVTCGHDLCQFCTTQ